MSSKSRDFYHIQDKLPLAWRYRSTSGYVSDAEFDVLSQQIQELGQNLIKRHPDLSDFIELSARKISLLERALDMASLSNEPADQLSDLKKQNVEVSLSSSGMGFFSETIVEDDAQLEISLSLSTVNKDIDLSASVLECRLSADSENPGYWIRVRFSREQDQMIDQLLAHVTQRQIERLQRKSDIPEAHNTLGRCSD